MKFVHIVFEAPEPVGSGAVLRNYALCNSLMRYGAVDIITVQDYYTTGKRTPPRKHSFLEAALSEEVLTDVLRRVAKVKPDLVIVEGVYLADIAYLLVDHGYHTVVDMHNIESSLMKETDLAKKTWRPRLFYKARWAKARKAEFDLAKSIDGVWVCSATDADQLPTSMKSSGRIKVVPNPIPGWCGDAPQVAIHQSVRALFVGHLGYYPNVKAVERLIKGILPAIKRHSADAQLDICGRNPGKRLVKLVETSASARLTINPDDLGPIYARSTVAVVPLDMGGGTRLKILEALAVGLPVVATAKAVEGLNMVAGETYLAAQTDVEFANGVLRLSEDPVLTAQIVENGREFVRHHHSSEKIDAAVRAAVMA